MNLDADIRQLTPSIWNPGFRVERVGEVRQQRHLLDLSQEDGLWEKKCADIPNLRRLEYGFSEEHYTILTDIPIIGNGWVLNQCVCTPIPNL